MRSITYHPSQTRLTQPPPWNTAAMSWWKWWKLSRPSVLKLRFWLNLMELRRYVVQHICQYTWRYTFKVHAVDSMTVMIYPRCNRQNSESARLINFTTVDEAPSKLHLARLGASSPRACSQHLILPAMKTWRQIMSASTEKYWRSQHRPVTYSILYRFLAKDDTRQIWAKPAPRLYSQFQLLIPSCKSHQRYYIPPSLLPRHV